jgi:hypothetical protein
MKKSKNPWEVVVASVTIVVLAGEERTPEQVLWTRPGSTGGIAAPQGKGGLWGSRVTGRPVRPSVSVEDRCNVDRGERCPSRIAFRWLLTACLHFFCICEALTLEFFTP